MQKNYAVTSSPHLRSAASTMSIMRDVIIGLVPAGVMSVVLYGYKAAILIAISVATAVLCEYGYNKLTKQKSTIGDLSAVVTGLLLAYNLPANAPWWIAVIGSFLAIILVKAIFGGIGANFMNPALTARAILFVSWSSIMTSYPVGGAGSVDTVSSATALSVLGTTPSANNGSLKLTELLTGSNIGGMLGETCKIALIIGGIYLIVRGVISWHIPVCFLGTVFVCYLIYSGFNMAYTLGELLSGGLILGAFFMAPDYVTSPVTVKGKIIYGIGCGAFLFVIRAFCSYVEGCSFAILFMNVLNPLIDRLTAPKAFGEVKKNG